MGGVLEDHHAVGDQERPQGLAVLHEHAGSRLLIRVDPPHRRALEARDVEVIRVRPGPGEGAVLYEGHGLAVANINLVSSTSL